MKHAKFAKIGNEISHVARLKEGRDSTETSSSSHPINWGAIKSLALEVLQHSQIEHSLSNMRTFYLALTLVFAVVAANARRHHRGPVKSFYGPVTEEAQCTADGKPEDLPILSPKLNSTSIFCENVSKLFSL